MSSRDSTTGDRKSQETLVTSLGRDPHNNHGIVNPAVFHASTILFPSLDALESAQHGDYEGYTYGRRGTPTTRAFEEAIAELEGGAGAVACSSGLAAITCAIMAFVKAGDHVLVSDSAYGPGRSFCAKTLAQFGVETSFYDPAIGGGIARLFRHNTRMVVTESPGSQTFEIQDIPAIAAATRNAGIVLMMDNTWATPLYFKPFEHGVNVSVHAATKYMVGHSDAMAGVVTADAEHFERLKDFAGQVGHTLAPDDCYLTLRGLRTMAVRLARHHQTGVTLAQWLAEQPEVDHVLHPALSQHPGHTLWRRDFTGASGLFGFVMKPVSRPQLAALVDHLELFGMGYSWGGFESLILPCEPGHYRDVTKWEQPGPTVRVHAGLEDPDDLIRDLEKGFARLRAAS